MFDYYVIAPSYRSAFSSRLARLAGYLIPPNVYYFETPSPFGLLRAKYAVVTLDHLERLTSKKTFHSYFWARFAQPMRLVASPPGMRDDVVAIVCQSLRTFLSRSAKLTDPENSGESVWRDVWLNGLKASYRAELRAESKGRAEHLLDHYGDWPARTAEFVLQKHPEAGGWSVFAWRMRAIQGAVLSVLRLLKATATFQGGIDYIAWKIERHSGIKLEIQEWERRFPVLAAPIVARRYYKTRARARAARPQT